jgi:hypothetical protein
MALNFVSCPYCNATFPRPDAIAPSGKLDCPRCGEAFPAPATSESAPSGQITTAICAPPQSAKRRSWRIGLLVFAGMVIIAVAALIFILNTRSKRGLSSLAELPTLGYLPSDTNVIVAATPGVADETLESREMLYRLGLGQPDDVESEKRVGGKRDQLDWEKYTGLRRDQIEDVVLGMRLDAKMNLPPPIQLIVRTRSTYDQDQLRQKLGVTRSRQEGSRNVDYIKPPGWPLGEAVLWCATSKTFIICLTAEDMAKVPEQPAPSIDHLPPQIGDLLRYRSDKGTFFYLVGHAEHWDKTILNLLLLKWPEEDRKTLFKIQTIGIGLRADSGATTSRQRPARISEEVKPENKGIAVDLVVTTQSDLDTVAVRDSIEGGVDRLKLSIRNTSSSDNRYSAELFGTPAEWETALQALKAKVPGLK